MQSYIPICKELSGVVLVARCACGAVTGTASPNRPAGEAVRCSDCTAKVLAKRLTENYRRDAV